MEIQRHVVDDAPNEQPREPGTDKRDAGSTVLEEIDRNDGSRGKVRFINDEYATPDAANNERDQCSPRVPAVHYTTPRQGNEKCCRATDEDDGTDIINSTKLVRKRCWDEAEVHKDDNTNNSDSDEGEIDVEYPPLQYDTTDISHPQTCKLYWCVEFLTHDTLPAKAPPMIGPQTDPTLHMAFMRP